MSKNFFTGQSGALKNIFAVPAAVIAFFAAQFLGAWAFDSVAALLLELWGVTAKSLPYAPAWLRTCIASYSSLRMAFSGLTAASAVLLCARFLLKKRIFAPWRHIASGAGIGSCLSALAFLILYPTGCVRIMRASGIYPLAELISFAGAAAAAFSAEALLGGFLCSASSIRRSWIKRIAFTALGTVFYGLSAPWSLPALMSVGAMSALCALLYEKRSFWAAASVRCFWAFCAHRVLGFSANGVPGIFFETYPVSRDWLTGGDLGLESGWLCVLLFAAAALFVHRFTKNNPPEEKYPL